ncbi:hypothetical protein PC116_g15076 [Phytophthora cactorum]|uniref:EF-hand domain-containing protein n=3 Tax=Phytophthora cactorum TaxID=29920 RepID=A0A8T1BCG8_9STRA|nr:hypothetical protein PC112_g17187 [Phytophthora cactorum]KAG2856214.1 hypothetical protein PC113_g11769 [Phytophthora cactorum]KAG2886463.1 hypothetical protein PC114_g19232 [Phytophthora cactorum]KAG2899254.1 hypothetical protein PC115_g16580 [Phytophthora cactorum]KAG2915057.1 hypothetical protein PC117_g18148 [Phytophthora cactorum]
MLNRMSKARNKIDQMSTADWQQYHHLLSNQQLMKYFADEVHRFSRCPMKPDDVLRRFSLNGDGHLDLREFQLAVTRLEIVASSSQQTDGYGQDPHPDRDLERAKELYLVFCPTQTRKLDIDLFCRIMTEWSLQLMRASYQHDSTSQLTSSVSSLSMNKRVQFSSPRAPLATPYATQATLNAKRIITGNEGDNDSNGRSTHLTEGETLWQRLATSITQSSEKLRQIFFKMDVMSSGKVSPEELELALSHIGVFLTTREYEKLYMSLGEDVKEYTRDGATNGRWRGRGGNGKAFTIKYAKFLALFQEKDGIDHRTQTMPSNSKQVSPPVVGVGSARLWDLLVAAFDKLQSLFHQFQRIGQYYLPPETFRDCLLRCGITLSNADFAALRVRLLPFSDSASGSIGVSPLLDALKAADRTTMKSKASPGVPGTSVGYVNRSPIRLGRKTVQPTAYSPVISESEPYPAGKSTQERNAEASRTIVKICDERRRESELHFPTATTSPRAVNSGESEAYLEHQHRRQDPFFSTGKPPPALEARILSKLQQLKQLGQLSGSSPQSVFPGDRFGHISRGQFRQSLSHLNLLVRYADVEALFWTLDTQGRGYITAQDFYDHLNNFATREKTTESSKQLPVLSLDGSTQRARLPRSVQKIFEKMLVELPRVVAICERMDTNQTGSVSTTEMLQAIHELGIMASIADKQAAIEALSRDQSQQQADQIPYHSLEDRLGALCSDLLSPRKRKKHLSTTSVLLAPHEEQPTEVASSYNHDPRVNDLLWNCPRRRLVQDHRAARSSIRIADELNSPNGEFSPVQPPRSSTDLEDAKSRQERRHRIALVSVLQDLLERRSDLKTALDLHRRADARGHVTKKDLVEILLTSRLNLHFPAGASAAQELVDELYPSLRPESGLGFLDVLRRISDLLGEVTKELSLVPPAHPGNVRPSTFSTNPYQNPQRPTGRRLNNSLDMHSSVLPTAMSSFTKLASAPNGESFAGSASTVRRKLLQESRLKSLLDSDYGLQSAAVLVRHAFKGLAPRDMVVPIDNGEFEATCRASDIKHVCYRLGLDLDLQEQQFVASSIDTEDSGFVSSPGLLDFFTKLTKTGENAVSSSFSKEKETGSDTRRSVTFCEDGQYYESIRRPNSIAH